MTIHKLNFCARVIIEIFIILNINLCFILSNIHPLLTYPTFKFKSNYKRIQEILRHLLIGDTHAILIINTKKIYEIIIIIDKCTNFDNDILI